MKRINVILPAVLALAVLTMPMGCDSGKDAYLSPETQGVASVGLDIKDYQMAGESIAQKLMEKDLPKGYVVALGPVDTRGTPYAADVQKLQDKIEAILNDKGKLQFTSAVDAMQGNSAAAEIYKLIEYNWWHNNPVDPEDMQKFGKLATVNGILFGRVSSIERKIPFRGREITYTFVWRLADTGTGKNLVTFEKEIRKRVR